MKIIEKITLILYSNIILIMSVILCLLVFGWLDTNVVANLAKALLIGETSSRIILGVSVVFILLSIRCIFFDPTSKQEQKDKQGVLLANDNGKLMISKETIEIKRESHQFGTLYIFNHMGRLMGLEPTNARATIWCVNQLHHNRHILIYNTLL